MPQIPSDYNLPHVDIHQKLPSVIQNALTEALSQSVFNRFYTQPELQRVIGTIGHSPYARDTDQIAEGTVYDQAFQLQPIITNSASTIQQVTTYKDLLRNLTQLGIDPEQAARWQTTEAFNYAPPINIDKLLNWNEYFWVGSGEPQYITIDNPYNRKQAELVQIIQHYKSGSNTPAQLAQLLTTIASKLDEIHANVPLTHRIKIKDIDSIIVDVNTPPTDVQAYNAQTDWALDNFWYHRSDLSDISTAKQAKAPIIEYNNTIQLTEWTKTDMIWKYRKGAGYPWKETDVGPTYDELFTRYVVSAADAATDTFTIEYPYLPQFVPGFQFSIQESGIYNTTWTVTSTTSDGTRTYVQVAENVIENVSLGNTGFAVPFTQTSKGDPLTTFNDHWLFVKQTAARPSTPPTVFSTDANISSTLTAVAGQTSFDVQQGLFGSNVARVYVNGIRQIGNYSEVSPSVQNPQYSINFTDGLLDGDVVTIYPYASAASDFLKETVNVRVSEDDVASTANVCLVEYRKYEQVKKASNQYPLFDLVDINGESINKTSPIFSFTESAAQPVNPYVGKRIVINTSSRDYSYNIGLVNEDESLNYYIDQIDGVCSVWRKDVLNRPYVPVKVNSSRQEDPTDATTVFEIPKTFTNNVHHQTRGVLLHSELFTHFKSIEDSQTALDVSIVGDQLSPAGIYRLTPRPNYGAGGTIKEYNYGFDRLVSSVISSEHSTLNVIDFAELQYADMLISIREFVETTIIELLNVPTTTTSNIVQRMVDKFLIQLENDAQLTKIFGDSTSSNNNGVKNWVGTLPHFGLATNIFPELLVDTRLGLAKVLHHDGHLSSDELNTITTSQAQAQIVKVFSLTSNGGQVAKPTNPTIGQLWYSVSADKIYRYEVDVISSTSPSNFFPEGSRWVNTNDQKVYVRLNDMWEETAIDPQDLWFEVDITTIILNSIVKVETILYESCPSHSDTASTVLQSLAVLPEFQYNMEQEFVSYCKNNNISNPYEGSYDASNAFTWNYSSLEVGGQTGLASYTAIYKHLYNTEYPHLQPWKIQGYQTKPQWWELEYKGTGRRWTTTMWYNIMNGIVPFGKTMPDGYTSNGSTNSVRLVSKTSVNITNDTTPDSIEPDGLFPPYWVSSNPAFNDNVLLSPNMGSVDDLFVIDNTKSNTFVFGSEGPKEYLWKTSISYRYGLLRSWFKVDPVKFLHYTFGNNTIAVDGLQVDPITNKVPSHRDALFHGDTDKYGRVRYFDGLNQWYVQFFRSNALDLNGSEFKRAWNTWDTKLGYDVGSFLVDKTLTIDSRLFDITPNDYSIAVKKATRVRSVWADALYLNVHQQGSRRELPLGAGRDWKFLLSTASPVSRPHPYYGVKKYRIQDVGSSVFNMIEGSLSSAGWNTGSQVVLDTGVHGILPNELDDFTYYFIIKHDDTTFSLADSELNAIQGIITPSGTNGSGIYYVAELASTFRALDGVNSPILWKHFALNKNVLKSFTSNTVVTGIQNVIDVIDGYSEYLTDQGFVFNNSSVPEYDAATNRSVDWQYVTESAIDRLYTTTSQYDTAFNTTAKFNLGKIALNPFSNNLWILHPTGVVSDFNGNDVRDVITHAMVYGADGKKINNRDFIVLRKDQITQLSMVLPNAPNDFIDAAGTTFNKKGFSGAHVYFDEYDQVILFNPYTIDGSLIYDCFLGIAIPKVHAYFEKQKDATKRPNVGGFLLNNGSLQQNYEYTVGNVLKYYDTFTVNENADFVNNARSLLGYSPNASYLAGGSLTPKSQFLFYKGMIKAKGTVGSINAFTNSKHFEASELDEFWAYRSYDFGDTRKDASYTLLLQPEDTQRSHLKLQFVSNDEDEVEQYFTPISNTDVTRWTDFPSQSEKLNAVNEMLAMTLVDSFTAVSTPIVYNGQMVNAIYHPDAYDILLHREVPYRKVTLLANMGVLNLGYSYITDADALDVYKNGKLCIQNVDYIETSSIHIQMVQPYNPQDVIVVIWKTAVLREGPHYTRLNNRTVVLNIGETDHLKLSIFAPKFENFSPVKLYDVVSNVTVADIAPWDPKQGRHVSTVASLVDKFDKTDPAKYNNTPNSIGSVNFWNAPEVGTTWADQSTYQYVNYNDVTLSTNNKLLLWGKVTSWSDPSVYQWTESSVLPDEWDSRTGEPGISGTTYKAVFRRDRAQFAVTSNANIFTTAESHNFTKGQLIAFGSDDTLPTPLEKGTIYVVDVVGTQSFSLKDPAGDVVVTTDSGKGSHIVFPALFTQEWYKVERIIENYEGVTVDFVNKQLTVRLPAYQEYSLFVDGEFAQDGMVPVNRGIVLEDEVIAMIQDVPEKHTITVMNKIGLFDEVSNDIPSDVELSGVISQQFTTTPCSVIDYVDESTGTSTPKYYFWVRRKQELVNDRASITLTELESHLSVNTNPYLVCLRPKGGINNTFGQLIIAGIAGSVNELHRYVLRFIDTRIMRQQIRDTDGSLLKPTYSNWVMFRAKQNQTIDRVLWNMVMESILGYSLLDNTKPIPSLDRIVYDNINGTNTRYGIESGQSFVDGTRALETIIAIINNPEIDYRPIDVDYFLQTHDITTKAGLHQFLEDLYATFPAERINPIFFAVMMDALTNNDVDYSSHLMKTSAISVSGIAPINVNGEFDA